MRVLVRAIYPQCRARSETIRSPIRQFAELARAGVLCEGCQQESAVQARSLRQQFTAGRARLNSKYKTSTGAMLLSCTCTHPSAASGALARPSLPGLHPMLRPRACQRGLVCAAPAGRPASSRAVAAGAARFGAGSAHVGATDDASRNFASSLALMVLGVSAHQQQDQERPSIPCSCHTGRGWHHAGLNKP